MVVLVLALILVVHAGGPVLRAQKQKTPPIADKGDPLSRYVSPSAQKSVEIGDFYLKRKKFTAALSRFLEALRTDPNYAPAHRELGKTYEGMGLWQKALEAYQKYLDELPSAKDAREAKSVHKAIARLQKEIVAEGPSSSGRQ
jgi:tetratricopeptide (TPR) repeat protein